MFILFYSFPRKKIALPVVFVTFLPPKHQIGCLSYFFLAKMGFLFRNSFKNPTPPTLPKTPVKKASPRLANGKSEELFNTKKKIPPTSPKRPKFPRNVRDGSVAIFPQRHFLRWPSMKDILRSSVVSVPSFLKFQQADVGSGSRDARWLVDSVEFHPPKKNGDSKKTVQQLKTTGFKKLEEERSRFFCMKSFLHRALIYPAMALEGSQIHWPCRLHGRVIILDELEMWIWVPQQPVDLVEPHLNPPVEWGNKTRILCL